MLASYPQISEKKALSALPEKIRFLELVCEVAKDHSRGLVSEEKTENCRVSLPRSLPRCPELGLKSGWESPPGGP